MLSTILVTATCLVGSILAQTPPSYTLAKTNNTLGLTYGTVSVKAGSTLGYNGQCHFKPNDPIPLRSPSANQ